MEVFYMEIEKMYQAIFRRKSIRKYEKQELSLDKIKDIENTLEKLKFLDSKIRVDMKIVSYNEISGLLPIKSPHYIVVSSEEKDGYLTNVGFILQQLDLYFSSIGLGSCWVGMARPGKTLQFHKDMKFVIAMAFGEPAEPLYRGENSEFKRLNIEEICNTKDKESIIECARLAPSATNSQPWYFSVLEDQIHSYCKKSNIITAMIYEKMNKIDMGIALCHLWIGFQKEGKNIEFFSSEDAREKAPKGYYYIGSIMEFCL
jgi:nitroreductase